MYILCCFHTRATYPQADSGTQTAANTSLGWLWQAPIPPELASACPTPVTAAFWQSFHMVPRKYREHCRCFYVVLRSARRRSFICYRCAVRRTTRSSRCSLFFDIMGSFDLSNGWSIVHAASSVASSSISGLSRMDSTFLPHPPTPPHSSTRRLRQTFPHFPPYTHIGHDLSQ